MCVCVCVQLYTVCMLSHSLLNRYLFLFSSTTLSLFFYLPGSQDFRTFCLFVCAMTFNLLNLWHFVEICKLLEYRMYSHNFTFIQNIMAQPNPSMCIFPTSLTANVFCWSTKCDILESHRSHREEVRVDSWAYKPQDFDTGDHSSAPASHTFFVLM